MKSLFKWGTACVVWAAMSHGMVIGCATAQLKTEASTSAIHAAQEAGAYDVPQASIHLQLAKEELAQAKVLYNNGKPEQANSMLMRAEADADLSFALSREDSEKVAATDAMERVRQLRDEK